MHIFRKIKAMLRLREAIKQADEARSKDGQRYYVMATSGTDGRLIIMDRGNFRKLKQKGYIGRNIFVNDLERECFYCTPYRNGIGQLSPKAIAIKQKQYYSWVEAIYKLRKYEQKKREKVVK